MVSKLLEGLHLHFVFELIFYFLLHSALARTASSLVPEQSSHLAAYWSLIAIASAWIMLPSHNGTVNFFPCFRFHSKATFPVKPPYEKFQPIIPHSSLFLLLGIYYYTILYNVHTNLYFQFTSQTISSLRMESFVSFRHFCIPLCLSHSK